MLPRVECAELTITQGTTRVITAAGIVDKDGAPLNVTGWSVHAVIRSPGVGSPVVAEWGTLGYSGIATATGSAVTLTITPPMSAAWTWRRGVLQAELTDPNTGRTERIIDRLVYLSPEAVTT